VLLSTAPAAGASEQVFDVAEAAPAWATYLCIAGASFSSFLSRIDSGFTFSVS